MFAVLFPRSHQILKILGIHLFPRTSSEFFLDVIGEAIEDHIMQTKVSVFWFPLLHFEDFVQVFPVFCVWSI